MCRGKNNEKELHPAGNKMALRKALKIKLNLYLKLFVQFRICTIPYLEIF